MNDLTILILGCDKHIEAAQRNYLLIKKLNPFLLDKIIFVTDKPVTINKDFFPNVLAVESNNYSERILKALEKVNAPYVMHFLDDDFIVGEINKEDLQKLMVFLTENNLNYCKLIGIPKGKKVFKPKFVSNSGKIYKLKCNRKYGMSLQPSIWKKEVLEEVATLGAKKGPTAWDTEISCYTLQLKSGSDLLVFNKNFIHAHNAILKGKLFPDVNKILKSEGIPPLEIASLSKKEYINFKFKTKVLAKLPFRNFWKKFGHLFGKKFYSDEADNS